MMELVISRLVELPGLRLGEVLENREVHPAWFRGSRVLISHVRSAVVFVPLVLVCKVTYSHENDEIQLKFLRPVCAVIIGT